MFVCLFFVVVFCSQPTCLNTMSQPRSQSVSGEHVLFICLQLYTFVRMNNFFGSGAFMACLFGCIYVVCMLMCFCVCTFGVGVCACVCCAEGVGSDLQ